MFSLYLVCITLHSQVFLDEVNTSSCLGLFKEIIVDHTIDGKVSDQRGNAVTITLVSTHMTTFSSVDVLHQTCFPSDHA